MSIAELVGKGFQPGLSLAAATKLAVGALSADGGPNAAPRSLGVEALEVAILDRNRLLPRKFRRITGERLAALLADGHRARRPRRRRCPPQLATEPPVPETTVKPPENPVDAGEVAPENPSP